MVRSVFNLNRRVSPLMSLILTGLKIGKKQKKNGNRVEEENELMRLRKLP